ncbi:hypothetical protein [Echinicola shivajiensis]|uniref:hypothetical protein n=1 Tax=Echinicola shivajiensis TaxID=1035916 RepID=UPI001BFC6206|nr:hypothetical protein [Echinicola shivajiensis]
MSLSNNILSHSLDIHNFHIPVMGLGFTIDTPLKVGRFGINSVVSIMEDDLIESMRKIHCRKSGEPYIPIRAEEADSRAKRITAYLNLMHKLLDAQIEKLKQLSFQNEENDLNRYFKMLPSSHPYAQLYQQMLHSKGSEKLELENILKDSIKAGNIDVNIMTKVDRLSYDKEGNTLPREFSAALSALRGFAQSDLKSNVVFSAGMNPALFSYLESFEDFFPDVNGHINKGIILKVSDYRSALIQGKFLAKKGLWVKEFRLESGLNCGGHAFATDGHLMGPILEEFKEKRSALNGELFDLCQQVLSSKGKVALASNTKIKITAQGGIGTAEENQLLLKHYNLDSTGWGSPFLMVPEATSVGSDTIQRIIKADKSDFFLSHASPLGVPFNNLRTSTGEEQRKERIAKDRPGSPCYKKVLSSNTEFTDIPICTSSRQYQNLKLKEIKNSSSSEEEYQREAAKITEKDCLCEGLAAPAILSHGEQPARNLDAVTICPGPNLAYFKGIFKLQEMVDHIYGKHKLTIEQDRPYFFIKELQLYMDYFKKELGEYNASPLPKLASYLNKFNKNLQSGIQYYKSLLGTTIKESDEAIGKIKRELESAADYLKSLQSEHITS